MNDEQTPGNETAEPDEGQHAQTTPVKPRKHRKLTWLAAVLIAVLAATAGGLGYFAYQRHERANSLANEILQLQETVAELETAGGTDATSDACVAGATYTADIGDFTVTLDSPYAIVRNLDAGFEGGPVTSLNVVTCLEDETGVLDNQPHNEVSVLANPSSTAADLRAAYESNVGSALTPDGTIAIDGVTADKYTHSSLFNTTIIFFDNDGIGYQIELSDTNNTTNAILANLTDGWSFTQ